MSNAKASLASKVRTQKRASWLNRTAAVLGCEVFVDHANNIILAGRTRRAHMTADVLKAYGSAIVRSELEVRRGFSYLFLNA